MASEYLRDRNGLVIGRVETDGSGDTRTYDRQGLLLGTTGNGQTRKANSTLFCRGEHPELLFGQDKED